MGAPGWARGMVATILSMSLLPRQTPSIRHHYRILRGGYNKLKRNQNNKTFSLEEYTHKRGRIQEEEEKALIQGGIDYSHFDHAWTNEEANDLSDHDEAIKIAKDRIKMGRQPFDLEGSDNAQTRAERLADGMATGTKYQDAHRLAHESLVEERVSKLQEDLKHKAIDYPEIIDAAPYKNYTVKKVRHEGDLILPEIKPIHWDGNPDTDPIEALSSKGRMVSKYLDDAMDVKTNSDIEQAERRFLSQEKRRRNNISLSSDFENSTDPDMRSESDPFASDSSMRSLNVSDGPTGDLQDLATSLREKYGNLSTDSDVDAPGFPGPKDRKRRKKQHGPFITGYR
ncbi:hypothetical protein AAMO2058_000833600 [Amorphochlora amoebiformis]